MPQNCPPDLSRDSTTRLAISGRQQAAGEQFGPVAVIGVRADSRCHDEAQRPRDGLDLRRQPPVGRIGGPRLLGSRGGCRRPDRRQTSVRQRRCRRRRIAALAEVGPAPQALDHPGVVVEILGRVLARVGLRDAGDQAVRLCSPPREAAGGARPCDRGPESPPATSPPGRPSPPAARPCAGVGHTRRPTARSN